jgi:hypothetical protein
MVWPYLCVCEELLRESTSSIDLVRQAVKHDCVCETVSRGCSEAGGSMAEKMTSWLSDSVRGCVIKYVYKPVHKRLDAGHTEVCVCE